jgi:predicted nucleotidyltransferase
VIFNLDFGETACVNIPGIKIVKEESQTRKNELLDKLRAALSAREEIVFACVHGSFLDGGAFRDIDIAVFIEPKQADRIDKFDYEFDLSVGLTKQLGQDVDVQVLNDASPGFLNSVFKNGEVLFSRDEQIRLDLLEANSIEVMDFHELSLEYLRECAGR